MQIKPYSLSMTIGPRYVMLALVAVTAVACHSRSEGLTQAQKDAVAASAKAVVNTIFEKSNQLDFAGALPSTLAIRTPATSKTACSLRRLLL